MASIGDGYSVGGARMNAVADTATANKLAAAIEDAEARKLGVSIAKARPKLASRLGASPGTLENIRRFRLKKIPSWLMTRIRAEFIAMLQAEIKRLEHEIGLHLRAGADPAADDLAKAQAQVEAAKTILTGSRR